MLNYRYIFEAIKCQNRKVIRCAVCGRQLIRSRTFTQTLNPYNRRADGLAKSRGDIMTELRAQAAAWQEAPETCAKCLAALEADHE